MVFHDGRRQCMTHGGTPIRFGFGANIPHQLPDGRPESGSPGCVGMPVNATRAWHVRHPRALMACCTPSHGRQQ